MTTIDMPNRLVRLAGFAAAGVLTAGLVGCANDGVEVGGAESGALDNRDAIQPRQVLDTDLDPAVGTDQDGADDGDRAMAGRQTRGTQQARTGAGGSDELVFPVADEVVRLQAGAPAQARVGEAFNYDLTVTNLADVPLHDVEVIAYPGPDADPEQIWDVGYLAAGQSETRQFEVVGDQVGTLSNCLAVEYTPTLCIETAIVQPQLALTKQGPAEAIYCAPFTYTYTVTNDGTGVANDVVIEDELPDGLVVADPAMGSGSTVRAEVGTLAGGASETLAVPIEATEPGTYGSRASASSGSLEVNSQEVTTAVREGVLDLAAEGPDLTYVGVPVDYRLVVSNSGDAASRPTTLNLALAGGGEALAEREVPALEPGQEQVYRVTTLAGARGGDMTLRATLEPFCEKAEEVVATVSTEVETISALQLEVIDTQDPVRLGDETVYIITVLNEGSQREDNVALSGELPDTLEFVGGTGNGDVTGQGQTVNFAPVSIEPGAEAKWEVTVNAVRDGQGQFALRLSAPSLERDAVEDEPTRAFDPTGRQRAQ